MMKIEGDGGYCVWNLSERVKGKLKVMSEGRRQSEDWKRK